MSFGAKGLTEIVFFEPHPLNLLTTAVNAYPHCIYISATVWKDVSVQLKAV